MIPVLFVLIVPTRVHNFETSISQWLKHEAWKNVLQPFHWKHCTFFKLLCLEDVANISFGLCLIQTLLNLCDLRLTKFQHYAFERVARHWKNNVLKCTLIFFLVGMKEQWDERQMNTDGQNIEFWYRPWMLRTVHFNLSFLMDLCQKQNIYAYHQGLKILIT